MFACLSSYSSTCSVNSSLKCPIDYASGVGEAYKPVGSVIFDDACGKDTLEPEHWQVEVRAALLKRFLIFC